MVLWVQEGNEPLEWSGWNVYDRPSAQNNDHAYLAVTEKVAKRSVQMWWGFFPSLFWLSSVHICPFVLCLRVSEYNLSLACLLQLTVVHVCVAHVRVLMVSAKSETDSHIGVCMIKFTAERIFTYVQIFTQQQIFTLQCPRVLYTFTLSRLHLHKNRKSAFPCVKHTNQNYVYVYSLRNT